MSIIEIIKQLSSGMGITIEIFFVTLVTSLILGLGLALVRMSKIKIFSILAKIYISIMRGTPLMLQLLVVYFGPYFIFGIQITKAYPGFRRYCRICPELCRLFLRKFTGPGLKLFRMVSTRRPNCSVTAKPRHSDIL